MVNCSSAFSSIEYSCALNNLFSITSLVYHHIDRVPHGAVNGGRKDNTRSRTILGKTQFKPTNTMGKAEKSTEIGPICKDKY